MKRLRITVDGKAYDVTVEMLDDTGVEPVGTENPPAQVRAPLVEAPAGPASSSSAPAAAGDVLSPLAGRVVSIDCAVGQRVSPGVTLVTLEAMKMNTLIHSDTAGTVKAIFVTVGDAVEEGQVLASLQ